MKTLFIVKEKKDLDSLLKMYENTQTRMSCEVKFLLIHDAVLANSNSYNDFEIFTCGDDVKARGINTPFNTLDYSQILKLIADCEKVICW